MQFTVRLLLPVCNALYTLRTWNHKAYVRCSDVIKLNTKPRRHVGSTAVHLTGQRKIRMLKIWKFLYWGYSQTMGIDCCRPIIPDTAICYHVRSLWRYTVETAHTAATHYTSTKDYPIAGIGTVRCATSAE